eukprot:CAMPEP_0119001520 /NCGR_PEP_ID=MMETSP1173-20130426/64622_1 /TAXON_ID=1034831 /ORGANISM="Rhizochromulina marina cf, Strain CCMP1243" /LENGTH=46 /DNA_ID= /DNA_START= /DNA_END= /DNA_ORIENTATION=
MTAEPTARNLPRGSRLSTNAAAESPSVDRLLLGTHDCGKKDALRQL